MQRRFDVRYPAPIEYLDHIQDGDVVVFRPKNRSTKTTRGYGDTLVGVIQPAAIGKSQTPLPMIFEPAHKGWFWPRKCFLFELWRGTTLLARVETSLGAEEYVDCPGHPGPWLSIDDASRLGIQSLDFLTPRPGDVVEFRLGARGRSLARSSPLRGIWVDDPPRIQRLPLSHVERFYEATPEKVTLLRLWRDGKLFAQNRAVAPTMSDGALIRPPDTIEPSPPKATNTPHLDATLAARRVDLDKLTGRR